MTSTARRILHVDMDAFYASVEQRDNPALVGQPVVVGGDTRGVVAAASYEARRFGIRSAMPMSEARRRCPALVRIPPRMAHYQDASRQIFAIFHEFSPLVEGLSLDEAFLDVSASLKLFGSARAIAMHIKDRIRQETRLTASVGVAENKLVAKIASDLDKPDGLCIVMPDDYPALLDPLPAEVIPGIGRETLKKLHAAGITTVRDLRCADDRELRPIFGRYTERTRARASGVDDRPVMAERGEKSISAEETYDRDLAEPRAMQRELLHLAERTAARLRKAGLQAGTVQVKIRRRIFRPTPASVRCDRPATAPTASRRWHANCWPTGCRSFRARECGCSASVARSCRPRHRPICSPLKTPMTAASSTTPSTVFATSLAVVCSAGPAP